MSSAQIFTLEMISFSSYDSFFDDGIVIFSNLFDDSICFCLLLMTF